MEGILEKLDHPGKGFKQAQWKTYYFILHEEILMFTEINNRQKISGKLHMAISKIESDENSKDDCEIKMNSGLVDVTLRA